MLAQTKTAILCTVTMLSLALAGCAEPQESIAPGPEYVRLGGSVFECDDTVSTDGVCDEYVLAEDAPTDAEVVDGTLNDDGTATIEDRTYVCDDTVGADAGANETAEPDAECEAWIHAEEE